MSAFSETDADVVRHSCDRHGIDYLHRVTKIDKLRLKCYTGLSVSLIRRALTKIRKSH